MTWGFLQPSRRTLEHHTHRERERGGRYGAGEIGVDHGFVGAFMCRTEVGPPNEREEELARLPWLRSTATVIYPSILANNRCRYAGSSWGIHVQAHQKKHWRDERARVKQPTTKQQSCQSTANLTHAWWIPSILYHIHGEIQGTFDSGLLGLQALVSRDP
jgi:hypothetical protein